MHPLLTDLIGADVPRRHAALNALTQFVNPSREYEAFLSEFLAFISRPPDAQAQLLAVQALAWLNDERLIESLLELAKNGFLRAASIRALGRYGDDEEALRRVVAALRDPDIMVREAAILGLGDMRSLKAVEPLLLFIEDHERLSDPLNLVAMAVRILGNLGDARAIEPLERLLIEADTETRAAIVAALANF